MGASEPEELEEGAKGGGTKHASTVEITFIGDYKNPWETNPAQEVAMVQAGRDKSSGKHWSPGTVDFRALSKSTKLADSYTAILAWLLKEKDGTVSRVNVISHGKFGKVGMKGTIDVNDGGVTFDSDPNASITSTSISTWVNATLIDDQNKSHSFSEIRAKFTSDAQIFIYSCNGATDPQLLQDLANAFGVKVNAANKEIVYCVDFDLKPPRMNRNKHRVAINDQTTLEESCNMGAQSDFHNLKLNRSASPKKSP
jgi:hypothetical protein